MIPSVNFFFTHTGREALANRNGLDFTRIMFLPNERIMDMHEALNDLGRCLQQFPKHPVPAPESRQPLGKPRSA